jgi:hydrogenase nickel incorporation protein HypA/HybF
MHELPVTQGVLSVAVEAAEKAGGRRIVAIELLIGDLSSIVDDSIQFYFDILSRGTLAEGAVLRIRRAEGTAVCWDCGLQFTVTPPLPSACPGCGSVRLQVNGGKECRVESIEVEDNPPDQTL